MVKPNGEKISLPVRTNIIDGSYIDELGLYQVLGSGNSVCHFVGQIADVNDEFILTVDKQKIWHSLMSRNQIAQQAKAKKANLSSWAFFFALLFLLLEVILFIFLSLKEQGLIRKKLT